MWAQPSFVRSPSAHGQATCGHFLSCWQSLCGYGRRRSALDYLEEFRAELLDIHPGRRLWHALSLLRGTLVLRLRRGHNNKAADAAVREGEELAPDEPHEAGRPRCNGNRPNAIEPEPVQGKRTNDYF